MHICNADGRCAICIKVSDKMSKYCQLDSISRFIIVSLSSRNIVRGESALRSNLVAVEVK